MNSEAESKGLEWLHQTATKGRMCEHRVIYEAAIQPLDGDYPRAVAMELAEHCCIVFTIQVTIIETEVRDKILYAYEFVALFGDRNAAIEAVFKLIPK
ncbi:MAG TPA: hypothetical protein VHS80_13225 [Chthoniobacterales bacterium]|jgi:hypothetical protein|nr:hypothetical protein [Chthoniobacterales bacterium]